MLGVSLSTQLLSKHQVAAGIAWLSYYTLRHVTDHTYNNDARIYELVKMRGALGLMAHNGAAWVGIVSNSWGLEPPTHEWCLAL